MKETYEKKGGRQDFVDEFLEEHRFCLRPSPTRCTNYATTVNEAILRSDGGVILPGPEAEAQGQEFHPLCLPCHNWLTEHSKWAYENGWRKRNPRNQVGVL